MILDAGQDEARPKCDRGMKCTFTGIVTDYRFKTDDRFSESFKAVWKNMMSSVLEHLMRHIGVKGKDGYDKLCALEDQGKAK